MATLEKPRQKKTKKSVPLSKATVKENKNETVSDLVEKTEECLQQENVASTSENLGEKIITSDEIKEENENLVCQNQEQIGHQETSIVEKKEQETEDEVKETNILKETVSSEIKETTKEIVPSAPIQEVCATEVLYPALPIEETVLQPFTRDQLSSLYSSGEVTASAEFVKCFVDSELRAAARRHPLYTLLSRYAHAREQLADNTTQLTNATNQLSVLQEAVWSLDNCTAYGSAHCSDGRTLRASHRYETASLQRSVLEQIIKLQNDIRKFANEGHTFCSYRTATLRNKIERHLYNIISISLENSELRELRLCISVLFLYERTPTSDQIFRGEIRYWLSNVVSALLTLADWHDHAYLLCQVLRCPPGVGQWAGRFIQVPVTTPTDDLWLDRRLGHALATLAVLMRPIERREEFLQQAIPEGRDPVAENLWVLVDSDGEEDENAPNSLRENDLVTVLNQIPFCDLFRHVLKLKEEDSLPNLDETHILRLFAFCTVLIEILDEGLKTYAPQMQRYQQFIKRLCRLVRHTLQYCSESCELLVCVSPRVQLELDSLLIRAARCLYDAGRLGSWQFLAVLPFSAASSSALWYLFGLLHGANVEQMAPLQQQRLCLQEARQAFEERLCVMSTEESYYLLNTFANIIMGRTMKDYDFIKYTTIDLLRIGFMAQATQETCSKCAAILLSNITCRYPMLISDIFQQVKESFDQIGQLTLYLFRELPLNVWRTTETDLKLISELLLNHHPTSIESRTARLILTDLNWNFENGVLWLGSELHRKAGLSVAEAVLKWNDKQLSEWAWRFVYRLKLHATDRGVCDMSRVPELARLESLAKGVRAQNPLCSYLALMMTTTGHLVPMVCSHGFTQLQLMLNFQAYEPVIVALYSLVPLFLDCSESLVVSPQFQDILTTILAADKTYMKMAKSFITTDGPGQILQYFASMIEYQINNPVWKSLTQVYAQCFLSLPNWFKEPGILYLLDMLVRSCYLDQDTYRAVGVSLGRALAKITPTGSLLGWLPSSAPPSLLPSGSSHFKTAYLANICLEVEHDVLERRTNLWDNLLSQLASSSGRTNVDACLKKACASVKLPSFGSGSLCLYRWAQLALDCALDHPLLPLIWQNFFNLYLARVPSSDNTPRGCVGNKFFDGVLNGSMFKKLKRRLSEGVPEGVANSRTTALIHAYTLWLEEPLLQESSLYLPALPPQYEPRLIANILHNNHAPWIEALNTEQLEKEKQSACNLWLELSTRKSINRPKPTGKTPEDDSVRMKRRLETYDKPLPPPSLPEKITNYSGISGNDIKDRKKLQFILQVHLRQLGQLAELYTLQKSEHGALDSQFLELLPHLYRTASDYVRVRKTCGAQCSGSANITVRYNESKINEGIKQQINTNRNNVQALLNSSLQPLCEIVTCACAAIENTVEQLCVCRENGAHAYFMLVDVYDEQMAAYAPAQQLFTVCCDKLADIFVSGRDAETARLCDVILEEPAKRQLIAKHFLPRNVGTQYFLQMYGEIIDKLDKIPEVPHTLLSKLDVSTWLATKHPRLSERSQFISLVLRSVCSDIQSASDLSRVHLVSVFRHDFPEHYGEVLRGCLDQSSTGRLPAAVWRDLLAALAWPAELPAGQLDAGHMRQLAASQRMLRQDMLMESTAMLGRYFSEERIKHSQTFGLYPRYKLYTSHLSELLSFVSHAMLSTAVCNTGAPGDKLLELAWPRLLELWGAWLIPGWPPTGHAQGTTPTTPWLQADTALASKMYNGFVQVMSFLMDALPASTSVMCYIWQFYAQYYTQTPSISPHILVVVHSCLLLLPWKRFWPSLQDLETMLRISDQYLPESHTFLSYVFLEIDWHLWLSRLSSSNVDPAIMSRVHFCLLNILVKTVGGEEGRNLTVEGGATMQVGGERAYQLLNTSRKWTWYVLKPAELAHVLDWYVMSADPRIVLVEQQVKRIDIAIMELITSVCCFETNDMSSVIKRQSFLRCSMKLLMNCVSRHKNLLSAPSVIKNSLINYLNTTERIISNKEEADVLISEILSVTSHASLGPILVECAETWLMERPPCSPVLNAVLRVGGVSVSGGECCGRLFESAFTALWAGEETPDWEELAVEIRPSPGIERSLANKGKLFTLHALLVRRRQNCENFQQMMDSIIVWLPEIKIAEVDEAKLALIWCDFMKVARAVALQNHEECANILSRLADVFERAASDSATGTNWFMRLAGRGGERASRVRLLARSLAGYLRAQLPSAGGVRTCSGQPHAAGQTGGSQQCAALLIEIANNTPEQMKEFAQRTLEQIQSPENSMHNAGVFAEKTVCSLYTKPFLCWSD